MRYHTYLHPRPTTKIISHRLALPAYRQCTAHAYTAAACGHAWHSCATTCFFSPSCTRACGPSVNVTWRHCLRGNGTARAATRWAQHAAACLARTHRCTNVSTTLPRLGNDAHAPKLGGGRWHNTKPISPALSFLSSILFVGANSLPGRSPAWQNDAPGGT